MKEFPRGFESLLATYVDKMIGDAFNSRIPNAPAPPRADERTLCPRDDAIASRVPAGIIAAHRPSSTPSTPLAWRSPLPDTCLRAH